MQATFLLGPAGCGKTHRCLAEIRAELLRPSARLPLVLLAPKQATFQLERQLLADPALPGYTRLQILSFERLAEFVLAEFAADPPRLLTEEGRVMVFRALLARRHQDLKMFRATARLPGFARQLSLLLRELQRHQLLDNQLEALAGRDHLPDALRDKLSDLSLLLRAYLDWIQEQKLQDENGLLDLATAALRVPTPVGKAPRAPHFAGMWLDGFAEMTPQELEFLATLMPFCDRATLAFCLDHEPVEEESWLSTWSVVGRSFRNCRRRLSALPECSIGVEVIARMQDRGRFAGNDMLAHLERHWTKPAPFPERGRSTASRPDLRSATASPDGSPVDSRHGGADGAVPESGKALRIVICPNPEAEITLAARAILRHVRGGGRFRDCAVVLRTLEGYHDGVRRVFRRYGIPFFLDRREPVAHHPLAELTRYSLRTIAFAWRQEDWFGVLKTGLSGAGETEIDPLENEALSRGWEGEAWRHPLRVTGNPDLEDALERLRQRLVRPFEALAEEMTVAHHQPSGAQLAEAVRGLWARLRVEARLDEWSSIDPARSTIHSTVWDQMQSWLDNLTLAFPQERMPLRDWLPILEAGLAGLTIGIIPPALDEVLVGAVDRSRNPELQIAFVLGLNESVFPAPPLPSMLLTDTDRAALEPEGVFLGPNLKQRLGRERYFAYIALTRARRGLTLTSASFDIQGRKLNPSPILTDLKRLFPRLEPEPFPVARDWLESEHRCELVAPLLLHEARNDGASSAGLSALAALPSVAPMLEQLRRTSMPSLDESLSPALAETLYGREFFSSITRLEKFAECPFRFFVQSGLRAQERLRFALDSRQAGTFQHEALRLFHEQVRAEQKEWREIPPEEGRARLRQIAEALTASFGNGVLRATERSRFMARAMTADLEDFIECLITWMRTQYEFNPAAAEMRFRPGGDVGPWRLPLSGGHWLVFTGVIDRVDLLASPDRSSALCVVIDYKSSARKIDPLLLENGIQLQLPAYLSVLRHLEDPQRAFGVRELKPAGVFYVSLRGQYPRGGNRTEVLAERERDRRLAYRHQGRFDAAALPHLDNRPGTTGEAKSGDQFRFSVTAKGNLHGGSKDPMPEEAFLRLLDQVEEQLKSMGERIFRGEAKVDPYRQGTKTPCQFCDYRPICRIDPWTHVYRGLRGGEKGGS